jgi:hypothetical protein
MVTEDRRFSHDENKETIAQDMFQLLSLFQNRNKHWQFGLVNPFLMHSKLQEHHRMFKDYCLSIGEAKISEVDLDAVRNALRFATAVYGVAYYKGCMRSVFNNTMMRLVHRDVLAPKDEPNNIAVMNVLALPRSALKFARWSYKALEGSYAIITDSASRNTVVAFRGSLSDADFLSDSCGRTSPFYSGTAHDGIARMSAEVVKDENAMRTLNEQLAEHPDYGIVVTGHSLGAGLSLLFAIRLLREGLVPRDRLKVFAFAPPPVLSLPEADCYDDVAMSFVGGTDIVCRLQLNSLDRLALELSAQRGAKDVADLTEELHIAGRIVLLTHPTRRSRNRLVEVPRTCDVLHRVLLGPDIVSDHLMDHYAKGLRPQLPEVAKRT